MKERAYAVYNAPEYDDWLEEQSAKSQVQVRQRISHIQDDGYFGDHKNVDDEVWELRWKNGRRIYYACILDKKILLLLGGNKNGQDKDIRQAKKSSISTFPLSKGSKMKLKKDTGIRNSNPTKELLDEELIGRAIWECLKNGDSEGVIEVISIYLEAANKAQIAKASAIARSTMYHTLKSKNPTVKTLAKLVHACV